MYPVVQNLCERNDLYVTYTQEFLKVHPSKHEIKLEQENIFLKNPQAD